MNSISNYSIFIQVIPSTNMSQVIPLKIVIDEDFPAIKKKKSRNPKPRDKWSLLWQIPSKVLNLREEVTDHKGQIVKKGKRFGFDTYNRLSCKVCKKTFHKYQSLSFHSVDEHNGSMNPLRSVSQSYRSFPQYSSSSVSKNHRLLVEPVRKSIRVISKPVSYDDGIEILDVLQTPSRTQTLNAKRSNETKFGKLTLSAKRKIVEHNLEKENSVSVGNKAITITKPRHNEHEEIEIVDLDDDEEPTLSSKVKITYMQDEELLLAEDDDDIIQKEGKIKKRKSVSNLSTPPSLKKLKTQTEKLKSSEMVEVKSASGKSMMVDKATLEKIMAAKAMNNSAMITTDNSEKLLVEEFQNKLHTSDSSLVSPTIRKMKTRRQGV